MFYRLSLEPWDQHKRKTPKISGLNGEFSEVNVLCKNSRTVHKYPM